MTSNQIAYGRLLEERRSHLANEEIGRQNVALGHRQADAAMLSAKASMSHAGAAYAGVYEQQRHNQQMEDIGWQEYYATAGLKNAQADYYGALTESEPIKAGAQSIQAQSSVLGTINQGIYNTAQAQHYRRQDTIAAADQAARESHYFKQDTLARDQFTYHAAKDAVDLIVNAIYGGKSNGKK